MARIAVVGTSGSGKTTFARALAEQLGAPHVELDALHWGPDWTPAPEPAFRAAVAGAVRGDTWVVDGNYAAVRPLIWQRADTVVWLDFSFPVVFRRAVVRTVRRIATGEELYGGNRERLRGVLDRDWIPLWVLRTFRRRRREYGALLSRPEHRHLRLARLRSPVEAEGFLARVGAPEHRATVSERRDGR